MMKENNSLPLALSIAGQTLELDLITVIPSENRLPITKVVRTIKIGNWKKRIIKKSSKYLGKDIKIHIDKGFKLFIPFILSDILFQGPFVYSFMSYKFDKKIIWIDTKK